MGNHVKQQILSQVINCKYYSIILDSTPDVSHTDELSPIIRYVLQLDGRCELKESFIDFVPCSDKTGTGLADKLCSVLEHERLNIGYMRGQGYDNGSNMTGIYNGVQALILKQNAASLYVPCAAHSLNLVGVHAASVNSTMMSFFGTIEKFFVFFSSSTTRWQILTDKLKISLKSHSDTRWCSKANAVKALVTQLPELMDAMQEIATTSHDTILSQQLIVC
jgi:hypothetical protein